MQAGRTHSFLICAQVLYYMFDNNFDIRGIKIEETTYQLKQFADDTTIFLDWSRDSHFAALNTLEVIGSQSGFTIISEKTKIVWLGRKNHSKDKFETNEDLEWGITKFNLLGLNFSVNLADIPSLNYESVLKKLLKHWISRSIDIWHLLEK